jgi:hypothetical protein
MIALANTSAPQQHRQSRGFEEEAFWPRQLSYYGHSWTSAVTVQRCLCAKASLVVVKNRAERGVILLRVSPLR